MTTGTIYGLLCPIKKEIVYVGQTTKLLSARLGLHKTMGSRSKRKSALIEWLKSLVFADLLDEILIVCLEDNIKPAKLLLAENKWIAKFLPSGNLLNANKINSFSRDETGERQERQLIDADTHKAMARLIKKTSLTWVCEQTGLCKSTISIAINEKIATKSTINIIRAAIRVKKDNTYSRKKAGPKKQPKQPLRTSTVLKRRPDADKWLNAEIQIL